MIKSRHSKELRERARPLRWQQFEKAPNAKDMRCDGLAPTSRATQQFAGGWALSQTPCNVISLRNEQEQVSQKRLYILDESSLASTKQS